MFDKIVEAQQKAEEAKQRLGTITVHAEVENGNIKVMATADKKIKYIAIADAFFADADKEAIEELVALAVNKALAQAENVANAEMAAITQQMMGGMGGLAGMFGK
jgi:nucleoid-associated protein EbfC